MSEPFQEWRTFNVVVNSKRAAIRAEVSGPTRAEAVVGEYHFDAETEWSDAEWQEAGAQCREQWAAQQRNSDEEQRA